MSKVILSKDDRELHVKGWIFTDSQEEKDKIMKFLATGDVQDLKGTGYYKCFYCGRKLDTPHTC